MAGDHREPSPPTAAQVWVAEGRAQGLRRRGKVVERMELDGDPGDLLELDIYPEHSASWIAGYGPDAAVLQPDTLRKAVHEIHLDALGEGR